MQTKLPKLAVLRYCCAQRRRTSISSIVLPAEGLSGRVPGFMLGTTSLLFQNEFQDHTKYAGNGQILDLAESKSAKLLGDIATLKDSGVTSGSVVYSCMNRRVKPLQK